MESDSGQLVVHQADDGTAVTGASGDDDTSGNTASSMTSKDYYFDSYSHFGKLIKY